MEMLSGAEMVVRSLIDQGVKQVFGYPGGAVLDIYDALHTVGGIDHVLVRHEQAAVHMADGLARATGEVGVVLVTSGPGATNAITGIATAYMDSIPLVVLSGQVATSLIGYDAFQECDMVGISRPVVKHSFLVKQTEDIPQVLKKAFWLAASGRPGPVVVDLPKDILNPAKKLPYAWPEAVSMRSYNPTTTGHKGQIKRALQTLVAAKKPVVYVGGGAITAGCHQQLKDTVEALNLPVVSSLMGLGAFPATHRQVASVTRITRRANIRTPGAKIKQSKKPRIRRGFIARLKCLHTSDQWIRSDSCYVNSCRTFLTVLNFELNVLTFSQSFEAITLDSGEVYEHVFAAISRSNEAKTFRLVEPLNLTFNLCHLKNSLDCFLRPQA